MRSLTVSRSKAIEVHEHLHYLNTQQTRHSRDQSPLTRAFSTHPSIFLVQQQFREHHVTAVLTQLKRRNMPRSVDINGSEPSPEPNEQHSRTSTTIPHRDRHNPNSLRIGSRRGHRGRTAREPARSGTSTSVTGGCAITTTVALLLRGRGSVSSVLLRRGCAVTLLRGTIPLLRGSVPLLLSVLDNQRS